MYTSRKNKWTVLSLLLVFLLLMSSVTAFASFESLSKNVDRLSRKYYVGEEVIFSARIENTGEYINTYYYIEDVFYGDLDYTTLYRDGNGDEVITFDGGGNVVAPDRELILDTDYFIDAGKIILIWIDGVGDPTVVGEDSPLPEVIPTFPGMGDNLLVLGPGQTAYLEMHYIVQPGDDRVDNRINTLGEDSATDKLSASVEVFFRTIKPDTEINITASAITVYAGDTVDLKITEQNTGNDPLTNVYVELYEGVVLHSTLDKDSIGFSGDTNTNGKLDIGETWQWMVTGVTVNADTNFEVLGFGIDSLGNEVSFDEGYLDEKADIDVSVIEPDTMVNITASAITVLAGDTVDLTITEENTGDDPLTDIYVELYKDAVLHSTLDKDSPGFSGDANANDILDVGETWQWMVTGVTVNADTNFEVLGFGTDSLGNEVSFAEGYLDEKADVDVSVLEPDTMVNITASAITVYAGDTVSLKVTEQNTGGDPLTDVNVELYKNGVLHETLTNLSGGFSGDVNTNGILDVGETWQWMVTGITVNVDTNFEVLGFGTDSLGNEVSFAEGYLDEKDDVDVYVIEPDTMVSIAAEVDGMPVVMVTMGDAIDLVITEQNTGDDPLTDVYVELYKDAVLHTTLDKDSAGFSGDANTNGILDVGETWQWMVTGVIVNDDTTFEVLGFGTDSLGNEVSYAEGYLDEKDNVTVTVENLCWDDETAWAYGGRYAKPNWDYVNNRFWGWTNGPLGEGTYTWDIYAGAGQNILDNGEIVGELTVVYSGGTVTVTYQMDPGFYLGETHLWVGNDVLPKVKQGKKEVYTNAPGQFPYGDSFGIDPEDPHPTETTWTWTGTGFTGQIYVAAHSVVWMSVPCEDPNITPQ